MNAKQPVRSAENAIVAFHSVSHRYPGQPNTDLSLEQLELCLWPGETLCLVGESGSGKTTALRLINRLESPTSGILRVRGKELGKWTPTVLRRSIGYVIQEGGLFPHLSVGENVGLLCKLEGWERERIQLHVQTLLQNVELDAKKYAQRYPAQLSGGERQRVGLARALALSPDLLLMDEPFGALDPLTRRRLQRSFLTWQATHPRSVLLVTHDLDEAFLLGDRIAILCGGRLQQVGSQAELLGDPANAYVEQLLGEFSHAR